jgi:hypothetical protein
MLIISIEQHVAQSGQWYGWVSEDRAEQSRAEQSRAEQSRAEQSRAEQRRAEGLDRYIPSGVG